MASDILQAEFFICGEETIAADGQEHRLDAGKMGTNEFKKVPASLFNDWFKIAYP